MDERMQQRCGELQASGRPQGFLSNNCVAKSRTWSPGRISLQPRCSKRSRATAPCCRDRLSPYPDGGGK